MENHVGFTAESVMKRSIRDILAYHVIPGLFQLRGGHERWLDKAADLTHMGVESTLVEAEHHITFAATPDWNSLTSGNATGNAPSRILKEEKVHFWDSYVYKLDRATCGDCIKRWGIAVLPGANVLLTGFSRHRFHLATLIPRNPFRIRREKIILCVDPYPNCTYGDILNITLPRLCRILSVMPEKEKAEACVAMSFKLDIAHQLVERLGIPRERHIDIRNECFGLTRDGWAYTCNTPSKILVNKGEYEYMRRLLHPNHVQKGKKRIYIKREATRRMKHEQEYIKTLLDMGFEIFDDSPRTLDEQIDFFSGAELIVAAHGAGMANMLWANPDVNIIEARDAGYWINCFRLWSLYNGGKHELLVDWSRHDTPAWDWSCLSPDLDINPQALMARVRRMTDLA